MPKELPPPLPPKERTVGQLVAESIRLYGHRFWPALVLGLPIAVVTQVSAGQSLTMQMIVLWIATPFLTAAYVRAIVLASPEPLERDAVLRAFAIGVFVFLPVPVLVRLYVLPALAWLALFGFAVPAAAHERLRFRDALVRGRRLAAADFVHALGSLCTLACSCMARPTRRCGPPRSSRTSSSRRSCTSALRCCTSTRRRAS
jgi:hypothetical protein